MLGGYRSVASAVLLAVGLAGYAGASRWLILAAAACLTLDSWRLWRLGGPARIAWTSKTTTYFVTGVLADLGLAALGFLAGGQLRLLLG